MSRAGVKWPRALFAASLVGAGMVAALAVRGPVVRTLAICMAIVGVISYITSLQAGRSDAWLRIEGDISTLHKNGATEDVSANS